MIQGLDLSDFQTVGSFHAIASSGVDFIICKATQGTGNVQATFSDYRSRIAQVPGLRFGAYHFMSWTDDALAQAEHFLSVYQPKNGDLPPALDCEEFPQEDVWNDLSADQQAVLRAENTASIEAFLEAVRPHLGGALPMVYASLSAFGTFFDPTGFAGHPAWVAAYNDQGFEANIPPGMTNTKIWQYSESLTVPSITDNTVDGDLFNGTLDDLTAFTLNDLT